jgi:hypothetical protein
VYSTRANGHKGPSHVKETVDRGVGPTPIPAGHPPTDLKPYFGFPPYIADPRNNNFLDPSFGSRLIAVYSLVTRFIFASVIKFPVQISACLLLLLACRFGEFFVFAC